MKQNEIKEQPLDAATARRYADVKQAIEVAKDWVNKRDLFTGCGYNSGYNFAATLDELMGYGVLTKKNRPDTDPRTNGIFYLYKAVKTFDEYLAIKEAEAERRKLSTPVNLMTDKRYADAVKATARLNRKHRPHMGGYSSIVQVSFVK